MSVGLNITANYLGRAYSLAAIYLFVPFYLAILGIEAYGLIAFYAVILAFGYLADAGLSAAFSREAAREPDRAKLLDLLTTTERVLLGAGLVFGAIVYFGSDYIATSWLNASEALQTETIAASLRLMSFTVPLQLGVSLYVGGLYGLQRQGKANAIQALYTTVRGGLVIPALYIVPNVEFFFAWQLASGALMLLAARATLVSTLGFVPWKIGRFDLRILQPMMHFAGGILVITILISLNTQLDKIIVNRLFSIADFGYFSLAWTLSQGPTAIAAPIMMALFPRMAALAVEGNDLALSRLYDACSYLIAAVGAVSGFALLLFAPEILTLWLGSTHVSGTLVTLVQIFAVAGLFWVLQMVPYNLCLAHGHSRTSIVIGLGTLVLVVPLVLAGASRFGLAGAAMPWIALNGMAFLVLAAVVMKKFYVGRPISWVAKATGLPLVSAATTLIAARLLADATAAGPIAACAWGSAAAIAAFAFLAWVARRRVSWLTPAYAAASIETSQ